MNDSTYRSEFAPCFVKYMFVTNKPFEGFCELIDNSIDANATEVKITYDEINSKLTIADNGCGISIDNIKQVLDYGTSKKGDNKIGKFGSGMKATPYYFSDEGCEQVNMTIESFHDGKRVYIEKYINMVDDSKNLDNIINSVTDTLKPNGTIITFEGISVSLAKFKECILKVRARYNKLLSDGRITIYANKNKLEGIDMFYNGVEGVETKEEEIECNDALDKFYVSIKVVNLSNHLRGSVNNRGSKVYSNENANELDKTNHTCDYDGVYICCGDIYITLGGADSFLHIGRRKHTYLNNCRVEINVPMKYKEYFANVIKTATVKYMTEITDSVNKSKMVFSPVVNWFKVNSPSASIRKKTNEDKNKAIKNKLFDHRLEIEELINGIYDGFNGRKFITNELRQKTIRLYEMYNAVSNGRNVPALKEEKTK